MGLCYWLKTLMPAEESPLLYQQDQEVDVLEELPFTPQ